MSTLQFAARRALLTPSNTGGGPAPPSAMISSIDNTGYGDGWAATWASGTPPTFAPDVTPLRDTIDRAAWAIVGGVPTQVRDTSDRVTYTQRIREPYNGAIVLTANMVAMSTYVYGDDLIGGTIPGGSMSSPKPVCKPTLCDMRLTDGDVYVEFAVFHRNARNGKQVAFCEFTCTDGLGNTFTRLVTNMSISTQRAADQGAVIVYAANFNEPAGFPDDRVWTVNMKAYPHFGVVSSVADSSTGTAGARGFVPQRVWKHAARFAAQPKVALTPTGVDDTVNAAGQGTVAQPGVQKVSTSEAVALANGFQSQASAMNALRLATSITGGYLDGCEMIVSNVTITLTSTPVGTYTAGKGTFVIRGDTNTLKASNVVNISTANATMRCGYLRIEGNLTITRTSIHYLISVDGLIFGGPAGAPDFNATSNGSLTNSANVGTYVEGCNFTGISTSFAANVTNNDIRLIRAANSVGGNWEAQCIVGSKFEGGAWSLNDATRGSGFVVAFNRVVKVTGQFFAINFAGVCNGGAVYQNVFEFTGTAAAGGIMYRPSGDGSPCDLFHVIEGNNTFAGAFDCGRGNIKYDETVGTYRKHTLCCDHASIHVAYNHKSDYFLYTQGSTTDAPLHTGCWSVLYGVDMEDVTTQYCSADGSSLGGPFSMAYPGLGGSVGTARSDPSGKPPNDPKFTAPACTTSITNNVYVAGAGNGNYNLDPTSPCRATQRTARLPFGIDGVARTTANCNRGALAA